MKLMLIYETLFVFLIVIQIGTGSYGVDYYLGSRNEPSAEDAFHGERSAKLDYDEKKRYIRADLEKPLSFGDLDVLNLQISPLTKGGKIGIDLYLDGNGDGKWSSKEEKDVKLYARPDSWDTWDNNADTWMELDGFSFQYKKSLQTHLGAKDLTDWQKEHPNLNVVRMYIRLYKPESGICLIDYLKIGDRTLSFEPFEDSEMKKGTPKKVTPGRKVTYIITYGNDLMVPLTNYKIVEQYDPRTTFISANPTPDTGSNNVWTIGTLPPGSYGQIVIVMRAAKQFCLADISGNVDGFGYVSVSRKFSTERSRQDLANKVTICCDQFEHNETLRSTLKPVPETSITFAERGTGDYESFNQLTYRSSKMIMARELRGDRSLAVVNLSRKAPTNFNTSWYASHECKNQKRLTMVREKYLYADRINCSGSAIVRSTRTLLESESNFSGVMIYDVGSDTKRRRALLQEILQGNFSTQTHSDVYK